jgi:hypothetical protein
MHIMAGEEVSTPEYITTEVSAVFEGALYMVGSLAQMDMVTLTQVHASAASSMVEQGRFLELSGGASENPDQSVTGDLTHRWQSYGMTMLAVEHVVDARNPGVEPPLSTGLRARARFEHADLDNYTPTSFALGFIASKPETPQA